MDTSHDSTDDFYAELERLPETLAHMPTKPADIPVIVSPTSTAVTTIPKPPAREHAIAADEPIDHTGLKTYSVEKSKRVLNNMIDTLEGIQGLVVQTADGKLVTGYATLGTGIATILNSLNTLGLAERKEEATKELEAQKHRQKIELLTSKKPAQHNTVNIIAGREEIMRMLSEEPDIQVRPIDNTDVTD